MPRSPDIARETRQSLSAPPAVTRGMFDAGIEHDLSQASVFRHRAGFLSSCLIAFTGVLFMMTTLREVLEPFLWAMFLVIALDPLTDLFEGILLSIGRGICGCSIRERIRFAKSRQRGCPLRVDDAEADLEQVPVNDENRHARRSHKSRRHSSEPQLHQREAAHEDSDNCRDQSDALTTSPCGTVCECITRIVAVTCSLGVVLGAAAGLAMCVLNGLLQIQSEFEVFEKGAKNAVEDIKDFGSTIFGSLPKAVVDEVTNKAISSLKTMASELAGVLFSQAGKFFIEFLMLGLYAMFWLCTPMPLNNQTGRIFRRYLFLKGSVCFCYGLCVGLMLQSLKVELAAVFGLLSFLLSFVPEIGAFFAMTLPMPVILFDSRLESPFLTLLIATIGQLSLKFVFSNIIEVKLVENDATMKMHPVVTLLAVTFFGLVWGPTGMLLSVPMMTYVKVVILSDHVPPTYRDPLLVLLEGDRRAPQRYRRRRMMMANTMAGVVDSVVGSSMERARRERSQVGRVRQRATQYLD